MWMFSLRIIWHQILTLFFIRHCLSGRYDPQFNCWSKIAAMNSRRLGVGVAVLGGFLYAVGGSDGQSPLNTGLCHFIFVSIWGICTLCHPSNFLDLRSEVCVRGYFFTIANMLMVQFSRLKVYIVLYCLLRRTLQNFKNRQSYSPQGNESKFCKNITVWLILNLCYQI